LGRLFGTDGARGVANSELTCELVMKIGRAAAMILTRESSRPRVMIGKDTRMSSDMLESAIAAGLCSVGADVTFLGVVPTPAVAYLVKEKGFDAGVMISASHNPCEYNGIKIFQSDGYKLPDELEDKIEEIILDESAVIPARTGGEVGRAYTDTQALSGYIAHVCKTAESPFDGMRIALDCANGSACRTAPEVFSRLGAECHVIAAEPDGVNINRNCGSTHMDALCGFVAENRLDAGFAFDGDADRMLAVDANGQVVDGDRIIALCAKHMKKSGRLAGDTAVVTVMSNMGFYRFCEQNGIACVTAKVGDRYVLEEMLRGGYTLGGEQSGHVIFLDHANTGDGVLTAVQVMNVMKSSGKPLSELACEMESYPQVLQNVRVSNMGKARYPGDEEIKESIAGAERELGGDGRVLVRVSGTEPLVRVMLEGRDEGLITRLAEEIAEVVRTRLL